MLQFLSGDKHKVITSVCLASKNKQEVFTSETEVHFKILSIEEIDYYIKEYQPFDKAGAYGIQEWIGLIGIEKIKGSYCNVVGLPVVKLYQKLIQFVGL
jgi:septum formation protein